MQKMPITLVMVLKDESKTVRKAIQSVSSIIDHVICGIDDKTSDDTEKEVINACSEFNIPCEISSFKFKNDFSSLRNSFIEKAPTDWVFILDGHDFLDPSCVQYFHDLQYHPVIDKNEILDFNIVDKTANPGAEICFQQPRLFKKTVKYFEAVHNVIMQIDKRIAIPQIIIYHDQPTDRIIARKKQRKIMNVTGLKKEAEKGDVRSMYYLGNTYYEMGKYNLAEKWYKKYIGLSDFDSERYVARIHLSFIYDSQKKSDEQYKTLISCFEDNVQLNEHLILLGDLMVNQGKHDKAKSYYSMATNVRMPTRFTLLSKDAYTWLPWYKLALSAVATNDHETVRECINKGKQLAPERSEFFVLEENINKKYKDFQNKKNGTIYVIASLPGFIKPFMHYLLKEYYVILDTKFNPVNADSADLIWCEWADHNAIAVSNYNGKAKKILRLHAYEAFSDFMNVINFDAFDDIIFVADHIQEYFNEHVSTRGNQHVIYNGVNLEKFQIAEGKKDNNKIAYAGYITNKKGAALLMAAAFELSREGYEFHVAGEFQEKDVEQFFKRTKPSNMFLYPWQQDLNEFYKDKTYIINTSPREGCPVAVLEGMAAGLKPLIYNWVGADKIGPYWWLSFYSLKLLIEDLQRSKPEEFRKVVKLRYNEIDQFNSMYNLITKLMEVSNGKVENIAS